MSVPPSAAKSDDTRALGLASIADPQERESLDRTMGGNAVGVLTLLGFMAFLVAYAVFGQQAAGIAFWAVLLGLPALLVVVSMLGVAWRRNRDDELLKLVTTLTVHLAEQHARAPDGDPPESSDV